MTDKPSRNEHEYFVLREAEILRKRRAEIEARRAADERMSHYMKCPKDGFDLESREFHGVVIETCPHCKGMWLDAGELDAVSGHDDHRGLLGRVFGDILGSLKSQGHHGGAAHPGRSETID